MFYSFYLNSSVVTEQ